MEQQALIEFPLSWNKQTDMEKPQKLLTFHILQKCLKKNNKV